MNLFSEVPRLTRGAIISIDLPNPLASVVVFQYNPSTISRSLEPQTSSDNDSDRSEVLRLKGAPVENISLEIEIDAADQFETSNFIERSLDSIGRPLGIYPQLSALEMLIYPRSATVIANTILAQFGVLEILPQAMPFTLLVWGIKRVLPVRVKSFSITEEIHDVNLNPIQAKVQLGLQVLNYNDLSASNPGYYLFLAHQIAKEAMATLGGLKQAGSFLGNVIGGIKIG